MTSPDYYDMKAKRNKIMDMIDNFIDRVAKDPTRALADIDDASKQMQALRVWGYEAHIRSLPRQWARP